MAARTRAKRRTRLVESDTEEALRRRGAELLGLVLAAIGGLFAAMLWSYSPDDPSLFSATDADPVNALGLVGASIADPLHRALGWAAWGVPAAFGTWGLRLVVHRGEGRAVSRAVLTPVALLAAAAFAASHVPPGGWEHDYGLGGLLGDAVFASLLGLVPLETGPALIVVTLALGLLFLVTAGYALGLDRAELGGFLRFLRDGSVVFYAGLHGLSGRAARSAAQGVAVGARGAADLAGRARAARAETAPPPKPAPPASEVEAGDGLVARIAAAVRAREAAPQVMRPVIRPVPPLTAGRDAASRMRQMRGRRR
jgi:DNA segregation ATPase FtsK/SpoIIIE, S-DNA-T family